MELTKTEFLELLRGVVRNDAGLCNEVIKSCLVSLRPEESQRIVEDLYFDIYCKEKVYTARSVSNPALCRRFFDVNNLCGFLTSECLVPRKTPLKRQHVNQAIAEKKPLCGYMISLSIGLGS